MLIYKPISKVLKKLGAVKKSESASLEGANTNGATASKQRSILVTAISAAIVVAAFIVLFVVLGGKLA